ncbi:MAG TPA: hypothetical protein PK585_04145 [Amphiplicatus sp.]|nr:hypothetical protein [Amphiplicatus sp.]
MAVGAGAGAAAAAAVAVGIALPHSDGQSFWDRLFRIQKTSSDICLKADMPLVAGMARRCYAPAEFAAFMDSPVLGGDGAPVSVRLAHPTDMTREPESVTTCNQYRARIAEGWYAETARDMAREGFFTRACGVVSMLAEARAPEVTYFDDGACTAGDIEAFAASAPIGFTEGGEPSATSAGVERAGESEWAISSGDQKARLQEFAHADFNGDGRGDMLVFIHMSVEGGSASASRIGYLDKPSASGPVTFVEKDFN